jgi:hypothetical protein
VEVMRPRGRHGVTLSACHGMYYCLCPKQGQIFATGTAQPHEDPCFKTPVQFQQSCRTVICTFHQKRILGMVCAGCIVWACTGMLCALCIVWVCMGMVWAGCIVWDNCLGFRSISCLAVFQCLQCHMQPCFTHLSSLSRSI